MGSEKGDAQFDDIRPGSLQLQNKLLCGVQAGVARGHKRNQSLAALLLQFLKVSRQSCSLSFTPLYLAT